MPKPAAASTAPTRPPRYDDVVKSADRGAVLSPGAVPAVTTNAPAGVVRGGADSARSPSFALDAREDDPGDRDRRARKPAPVVDLISKRLEMPYPPSTGDRFDWCRDVYGHRMQFSRRYVADDVLVDLFPAANNGVRDEIARKRAAVEAHNVTARAAIEVLLEAAQDDAAVDAGMAVMRQRGDVPFGYLPLVGMNAEVNVAALKAGAVLDLPETAPR